jgi:small subunit ribosomal protein S2
MALPTFTMRQLLEAGVHFGHHTRRWNPKMGPFLFGVRNGIHIIDLQQTVPMLYRAMEAVRDVASGGGRVLFVGTKRQAAEPVAEAAKRCGQYFVNHRWLGGMLTNWQTISQSIHRLREMDEKLADENVGLTKKERLHLTRERDKLERALGGIKEMGGLPDILFVIDTIKEAIAIKEASKLGLPVIAIVDSNSDPEGIPFPVPGNDDAMRAIELYCQLMSDAVLDGLQREMISSGADIGAAEEAPRESLPELEAGEGAAGEVSQGAGEAARPHRAARGGEAEKPGRSRSRAGKRGAKPPAPSETVEPPPSETAEPAPSETPKDEPAAE